MNLQNVIAFIWDFDKTLSPGYMQTPLFAEYGIDEGEFWNEVNGLVPYYKERNLAASKDTVYLGHLLSYVREGRLPGLTNEKLRELGALIELAPGMPEFMERSSALVRDNERYSHYDLSVEHYIVSTGLRQMIEGSRIRLHVKDVWACELLPDPPGPGYSTNSEPPTQTGVLSQIGYVLDNTTKTRAIFEINKGVNHEPTIDVNARIAQDDRRVPIANMIYIADGPSDVPVFSVVGGQGGRTLGVWTPGKSSNYKGVKQLQDDGRVNSIAEANYSEGSAADMWLTESLIEIADRICDQRDRIVGAITAPAGHKV